jgi:outer membrane protein assembly factor BamB
MVVGDRVFVTAYSGYGLSEDSPGQPDQLQYHVVCLNRADGKRLWDKTTPAQTPENEYRGFVALHGYASATPASDGQAVYAFFGRSGVVAYRLEGQQIWQANVGAKTHQWGSAASPVLCKNLLIVNASIESGAIVALDKTTGREVWRAKGIEQSWSTPLVVTLPGGRQELVVSAEGKVLGYDPADGRLLWQCAGVPDYVCPSVIAHDGVVYVTAGRKGLTLAIRAGGRGDVTETHLLWKLSKSPKVSTPLYCDGHLYWISHQGIAVCIKADTGQVVYEQRLEISGGGDKVYASLVAADGNLYAVTRQDETIVLAASPQFQELGRNQLDDSSVFNATPAISNGQLLVRSNRFLYCLGK